MLSVFAQYVMNGWLVTHYLQLFNPFHHKKKEKEEKSYLNGVIRVAHRTDIIPPCSLRNEVLPKGGCLGGVAPPSSP